MVAAGARHRRGAGGTVRFGGEHHAGSGRHPRRPRTLFPATATSADFDTAAVGLASRELTSTYHEHVDEWSESGLDYLRGEAAAETARGAVAASKGADRSDIALIASVSAAAGLVAAQFGPAGGVRNVVIGEREYSSNHFPWRLLADEGYEVRQVPFRNGGLEVDDIAPHVDRGTQLVAFSGVHTASATAPTSRRSQRWLSRWVRSSSSTGPK